MFTLKSASKIVVIITIMAVSFGFFGFATPAQAQSANKAIYFEPLSQVVVPGEWLNATMKFEGDLGQDFGNFTIRLNQAETSTGIKLLGWSNVWLSSEKRIVLQFLTDARLVTGVATAVVDVTDETSAELRCYATFAVAKPLPNEFFSAARKSAVGNVPLYNSVLEDGRVQALSNFQTKKTFKRATEIYTTTLKKSGWSVVQNKDEEEAMMKASGFEMKINDEFLAFRKGSSQAVIRFYTDPANGDRWVTVGVTQ